MTLDSRCMPGRRLLATAALVSLLSAAGPMPVARVAWAAASPELTRAQEHYDFAEFDRALGVLDGVIAAGKLAGNDLRDAYVLRARSLVGLGDEARARGAFCDALRIDREWRPDVDVYPKAERDAFDQALAACALEPVQPVAPAVVPPVTPPATITPTPVPSPPVKAKESKAFFKRPLTLVAGGLLLIGGVLGLSGGGGGDEGTPAEPLPDFPDPPVTDK